MSEDNIRDLRVKQDRLMADIHFTAQWGTGKRWGSKITETGMQRLALSDSDRQARDWFVETAEALGCSTTVDEIGNIFAIRPGRKYGAPTVAGSHLDTQPTGGRYDGILGVTAGLEMLKVLNEHQVETEYPVGVVNWTNEEGARFPISMMASGVWAGKIPLEKAYNTREVGGGTATVKSELSRIGYMGQVPASHTATPLAAHFELHIEHGPILEAENRKIGVVKGVQGYRWFTIEIKGRDCHTGTTPLAARSDALLLASKLILQSHRSATTHNALASTGILTLEPGSTNTVPGKVRFSLDIRSSSDATVDALETELRERFDQINRGVAADDDDDISNLNAWGTPGKPCEITWTKNFDSPAVKFNEYCIECVRESCVNVFSSKSEADRLTVDMTSGAGHDSVYTSKHFPTSMIFIPCRDGVSHNPAEYSTPEDCALGAQVLLQSVLRFDRRRSKLETA